MRTGCRYSIWFATGGRTMRCCVRSISLRSMARTFGQDGIEQRKRRLAGLLRRPHDGMAINEHYGGDGAVIFKHACALGCEGIAEPTRDGTLSASDRQANEALIQDARSSAVRDTGNQSPLSGFASFHLRQRK